MTLFANYSPSGESPERELSKAMQAEPERRKYEAYWSGLSVPLAVGTAYNLVTILKAIAANSGGNMSTTPLINTTTDKITPFNENKTMWVKLSLAGTYPGGTTSREMEISFNLATPDIFTASRVPTPPLDRYTATNIISVDRFGFAATQGFTIGLTPYGGTYTLTEVKLVIEQ